jgi:hypothetical protein
LLPYAQLRIDNVEKHKLNKCGASQSFGTKTGRPTHLKTNFAAEKKGFNLESAM